MIVLLLVAILAVLLIANHSATKQEDVTPTCNAGLWLLAVVSFMILLGVAAVVGGILADPRIVAQLGNGP